MGFQIEIIDAQPQPALAIRTTVPVERLGEEVGKAYGMVIGYLASLGEQAQGPAFICYHSMDMAALDVEIGFPVPREIPGAGPVIATQIAGGRRAVTHYKGPYEGLKEPYEALMGWIPSQGETWQGMSYEFYFNSPDEVPPSELLTRIELLLA